MRRLICAMFILAFVFLFADEISVTLAQIEKIKQEINQNEILVERKINDFKKTNPLFAEQGLFESDKEYLDRMNKTKPEIDRIKKQYLGDLLAKLNILRSKYFETENIQIDLNTNNYDPNTEIWKITIRHLDFQQENLSININISKKDASDLHKHWDKVKKIGILTIDIGDYVGLAKLILKNPITDSNLEYEIQPMKSFKHSGDVESLNLSDDSNYLATATRKHGTYQGGGGYIIDYVNLINIVSGKFDLEMKNPGSLDSFYGEISCVDISPDGNLLAFSGKHFYKVYNIKTGEKIINFFEKERGYNKIKFSPNGLFLSLENYYYGSKVISLDTKEILRLSSYMIFSNNNTSIVKYSKYGEIKILDLMTGNVTNVINLSMYIDERKEISSVSYSDDDKYLAICIQSKIVIFDVISDTLYKILNIESDNVLYGHNNKTIVTASISTGKVNVINIDTEDISWETTINNFDNDHRRLKYSIDVSKDGRFIAIGFGKNANIYRIFTPEDKNLIVDNMLVAPPLLKVNVRFIEPSGNKFLDALEKGEIQLAITNSGKGNAKGISIKFDPVSSEGLNYNNDYIEEILSGTTKTVSIPIEAYIDVKDSTHLFQIGFDEINGFPPAPVEIGFSTKAFQKADMFIVDLGIEDSNKNGLIESGEMIHLTLRLGNKGKGTAVGCFTQFYVGDNVFITDLYPKVVNIGDIEYNQYIDVPLEFFVNDRTIDEIPLFVDITESTGLATVEKMRLPLRKSEKVQTIHKTVITGIDTNYGDLNFENDLSIDIEQNIPISKNKNNNAIAVILGIENYRNISNVNFAFRDATIMKEYFSKTIGIPDENIYFRANDDVTLGEFRKIFSTNGWLDKRIVENKTDIYIYYAGHGAPAIKEEKAFLIPYDGDPNYPVQTGYSLETIYENLSELNAKSVTVFLDACFTGANRENEMLLADARPVSIQLRNSYVKNVSVFSATSNNEISSSYPQKKHGLFSYFLMKGMQGEADANRDNQLTIQELFDYVKSNVSKIAGTLDREQTPQLECLEPEKVIINYQD